MEEVAEIKNFKKKDVHEDWGEGLNLRKNRL